jgi:hypothetical protein
VFYVSYSIFLFKNILGTYVVMSSNFQNGIRSKTTYGCGFTGHPLGSSILILVSGDDQVALGGRNGGESI